MSVPKEPSNAAPKSLANGTSYYDEGEGTPVIAVHGLPGSGRDFRWLAPVMRGRFIRIDLPGFGGTPLSLMPSTRIEDRARFVLDLANALGLERFHLLGHSMGGWVSARAASLAGPRVQSLSLVSSIGPRPHRLYRKLGPIWHAVPFIRGRWLERAADPVLTRLFENGGFRGPYPRGAMLHTLRCIYGLDFAEHGRVVASLEVPTLVAYCENDPLIEVPIFEELQALAKPGPRLRYADGAHNPQKAHAVELGAAISAFVAQPTKQG